MYEKQNSLSHRGKPIITHLTASSSLPTFSVISAWGTYGSPAVVKSIYSFSLYSGIVETLK